MAFQMKSLYTLFMTGKEPFNVTLVQTLKITLKVP